MFVNTCTACDRRQLIFPSQIVGVLNRDDEIAVDYTCWCGAAQTWTAGNDLRDPVAA